MARLGQSGRDCYQAIVKRDAGALGASLNLTMKCWETLLPHVVRHPLLRVDLMALLQAYQRQYLGAMYSGCGGGYLMIVSNEPVPGAFKVNVRIARAEIRAMVKGPVCLFSKTSSDWQRGGAAELFMPASIVKGSTAGPGVTRRRWTGQGMDVTPLSCLRGRAPGLPGWPAFDRRIFFRRSLIRLARRRVARMAYFHLRESPEHEQPHAFPVGCGFPAASRLCK